MGRIHVFPVFKHTHTHTHTQPAISHSQYFGTSPKFRESSKVTWGSAVAATSSCNALRYNFSLWDKFNKTQVNNHFLLQTDNCSVLIYFGFSFSALDEKPSPLILSSQFLLTCCLTTMLLLYYGPGYLIPKLPEQWPLRLTPSCGRLFATPCAAAARLPCPSPSPRVAPAVCTSPAELKPLEW